MKTLKDKRLIMIIVNIWAAVFVLLLAIGKPIYMIIVILFLLSNLFFVLADEEYIQSEKRGAKK